MNGIYKKGMRVITVDFWEQCKVIWDSYDTIELASMHVIKNTALKSYDIWQPNIVPVTWSSSIDQ